MNFPDSCEAGSVAGACGQEVRPPNALRILLVEDNPLNQKLCLLILGKLGYVADIANDGLEALDVVRTGFYDVVLMDVQMPRLNGIDACRAIREELPSARQPWIIALTAHTFEAHRLACFAAGMNDYLTKPIRRELLDAALRSAIGVKDAAASGSP